MMIRFFAAAVLLLTGSLTAVSPEETLAGIPAYETDADVTGNLSSVGSDTLNNLMTLWAEDFQRLHPSVVVAIEGKGSSTAPPALIEGTAQLGPMSREMTASELDAFEARYGYPPTLVPVGIDALAVFVHKDNPLDALSLSEIDGIFSSTYRRGAGDLNQWGDVGLDSKFTDRRISVFGRNSASGTYGFFKEVALLGGDYKDSVKEQPGSSAVVQGVATDLYGIGYSGIGYATSGVRALPVRGTGGRTYAPSYANTLTGEYPLARFLIIYVNKAPDRPLDPLTLEFLRFVLSREGQGDVAREGYYPLPVDYTAEVLQSLGG